VTAHPRVIVLGAAGQLGRQVVATLRERAAWDVVACDRADLDITDESRVRDFVQRRQLRWLVNCAAMTNVDACESQTELADAVNAHAVAHLAAACNSIRAKLLHVSTDYVFDGCATRPYREDHPTAPINAYGRSKCRGEENARSCPRHLIVRTAWLYGPGAQNFVSKILDRARSGLPCRVVNDQFGTPTYAPDLADALERLMRIDATGTYHVTNTGRASWHELATAALAFAGLGHVAIEPVPTSAYPTAARRPAFSVLDCTKYVAATGHELRPWKAALRDYIDAGP